MITEENKAFATDILNGLRQYPKRLPSKYFYDAEGDQIFREIMNCPEYYLTGCEMEIFQEQTEGLYEYLTRLDHSFDLIELGPGDCTKTVHLLRKLWEKDTDFTYLPIDISPDIIDFLEITLPVEIPGKMVKGFRGDYFDMLDQAVQQSQRRKVVLCLGANIGNMTHGEAVAFIARLHAALDSGDLLVIGFDLIKNPKTIRDAYDDAAGITRRFNLNMLNRINRELGADFNTALFEHYCSYEPETGSCKSFLISREDTVVHIDEEVITFHENEYIWTEISQKYTIRQTEELAYTAGFFPSGYLTDSQRWFADTIWIKI